ncbi:alpha/beta fold hydrolase [Streptomyces sp. 1222.5]|uniref:alpha/beta fold hydrolase n=1 Tax=Streptomyces sp. 1222.5 TaxID=1881026 RepID=UPI003EB9E579
MLLDHAVASFKGCAERTMSLRVILGAPTAARLSTHGQKNRRPRAAFCSLTPEVLAVSKGPAAGACLAQSAEKVGWQERPSWYVLCTRDRIVAPEAQQGVAERIGAKVFISEASHAVVRSRPGDVVEAIEDALTYAHGTPPQPRPWSATGGPARAANRHRRR